MLDEEQARTRRHRGSPLDIAVPEDLTRLVSLSDGVFAFAMTLLVLNLVIPTSSQAPTNSALWAYLRAQLQGPFELYALGFLIVAVWWRLHVRVFRDIRSADATIFWFDICYLLLIGVTPFTVSLLLRFPADAASSSFYSATQALVGLTGAGIRLHCARRPELCKGAPPTPRQVSVLFATPALFGAATLVALIAPIGAEVLWFSAVVVGNLVRRYDSAEGLRLKSGEVA
ncbi:MAG: DUF1211 domain-containing protein [Thermoplasmata archaeon]|nr:DUF1211 domain-containing protein [Thermoplasmata archaeon]MCI4341977.1 DUF1211 domain-containing protein [Thermoplasmata archaeon]